MDLDKVPTDQMWFPSHNQLRYLPNKNWWNSAWLGTIWMVMMLPRATAWHLKDASFPLSIQMLFGWIHGTVFNGIIGNLNCENISDEVLQQRLDSYLGDLRPPKNDR